MASKVWRMFVVVPDAVGVLDVVDGAQQSV
jgi:hypothetical protein